MKIYVFRDLEGRFITAMTGPKQFISELSPEVGDKLAYPPPDKFRKMYIHLAALAYDYPPESWIFQEANLAFSSGTISTIEEWDLDAKIETLFQSLVIQ